MICKWITVFFRQRFVHCCVPVVLATALPVAVCAQSGAAVPNIVLPPGFSIELYSDKVPNARSLALGDNGTVFVSTRRDGRVYAVVPQDNGDPVVHTLARGLKTPNGIAFYAGDLFVAETERLLRFVDIENQLDDPPQPETIGQLFPTERHHGWRYIRFDSSGKLYVSIGAPCNVCDREGFGVIQRMNPDGSDRETVAYGVRNSVGLAFHPDSGEMWFTDNGRDMLGDDLPAGELNRLSADGEHFGFPYCHGGDVADPEFGLQRSCEEFTAPEQQLGPHVAPLGLVFYDGGMFPDDYQGNVYIAEHGSWNRSQKIGYRITMVSMRGDSPDGYSVFAEGWLKGGEVSGRPVDLLVLQDGSMLVSDDQSGSLYRIRYTLPLMNNTSSE
jgi:glucose/arabinose dehydrogenase